MQRSTLTVPGPDGSDLPLHVHRPEGVEGPLPGVLHLHGGGTTLLSGSWPAYLRWRDELAATGMVFVGVEVRGVGGARRAGEPMFRAAMPELSLAQVADVRAFAERLPASG